MWLRFFEARHGVGGERDVQKETKHFGRTSQRLSHGLSDFLFLRGMTAHWALGFVSTFVEARYPGKGVFFFA